ncbi:hypothetical protein DID78_01415 [Candidatus Marinamargulisbacteria bacterium SCGC AG-343-D04]|nr:hypothetical protein DID78_01415 [Candidatus Marinamargulisbacteria bacterium SCGC AG-343-D04]
MKIHINSQKKNTSKTPNIVEAYLYNNDEGLTKITSLVSFLSYIHEKIEQIPQYSQNRKLKPESLNKDHDLTQIKKYTDIRSFFDNPFIKDQAKAFEQRPEFSHCCPTTKKKLANVLLAIFVSYQLTPILKDLRQQYFIEKGLETLITDKKRINETNYLFSNKYLKVALPQIYSQDHWQKFLETEVIKINEGMKKSHTTNPNHDSISLPVSHLIFGISGAFTSWLLEAQNESSLNFRILKSAISLTEQSLQTSFPIATPITSNSAPSRLLKCFIPILPVAAGAYVSFMHLFNSESSSKSQDLGTVDDPKAIDSVFHYALESLIPLMALIVTHTLITPYYTAFKDPQDVGVRAASKQGPASIRKAKAIDSPADGIKILMSLAIKLYLYMYFMPTLLIDFYLSILNLSLNYQGIERRSIVKNCGPLEIPVSVIRTSKELPVVAKWFKKRTDRRGLRKIGIGELSTFCDSRRVRGRLGHLPLIVQSDNNNDWKKAKDIASRKLNITAFSPPKEGSKVYRQLIFTDPNPNSQLQKMAEHLGQEFASKTDLTFRDQSYFQRFHDAIKDIAAHKLMKTSPELRHSEIHKPFKAVQKEVEENYSNMLTMAFEEHNQRKTDDFATELILQIDKIKKKINRTTLIDIEKGAPFVRTLSKKQELLENLLTNIQEKSVDNANRVLQKLLKSFQDYDIDYSFAPFLDEVLEKVYTALEKHLNITLGGDTSLLATVQETLTAIMPAIQLIPQGTWLELHHKIIEQLKTTLSQKSKEDLQGLFTQFDLDTPTTHNSENPIEIFIEQLNIKARNFLQEKVSAKSNEFMKKLETLLIHELKIDCDAINKTVAELLRLCPIVPMITDIDIGENTFKQLVYSLQRIFGISNNFIVYCMHVNMAKQKISDTNLHKHLTYIPHEPHLFNPNRIIGTMTANDLYTWTRTELPNFLMDSPRKCPGKKYALKNLQSTLIILAFINLMNNRATESTMYETYQRGNFSEELLGSAMLV